MLDISGNDLEKYVRQVSSEEEAQEKVLGTRAIARKVAMRIKPNVQKREELERKLVKKLYRLLLKLEGVQQIDGEIRVTLGRIEHERKAKAWKLGARHTVPKSRMLSHKPSKLAKVKERVEMLQVPNDTYDILLETEPPSVPEGERYLIYLGFSPDKFVERG